MNDSADRVRGVFDGVVPSDQITAETTGPRDLDLRHAVPVVSPATEAQASEVLKAAHAERLSVVPIGGGSAMHHGNLPAEADVLVSTELLDATVDYEPRDLTVVVESGKRLAQLQDEARGSDQFLALDPPNASRATVGGVLSTSGSGPMRRTYGTPRDLCLGIRAVLADGTIIKSGGRVVKNVAGYDLTKLFIGSHGTLGLIVQAAFRLHPLPRREAGLLCVFKSLDEATSAACTVTHSQLQPRVLELIDLQDAMWGDTSRDESAPALLITFGDIPEAVDYQVERGASAMHEAGSTEVRTLSEEDVGAWHTRIRDVLDAAHEDPTVVVCRIGTLMTTVPLVLRVVGQLAGPSEPGVQSMVDWSDGIVRAVVSVPASAETSEVASAVEKVRQQVMEAGGRLVVESAPADVKRLLDVWGPPTGPVALMQQLKDRLDPHHLLNRGRYHREIGG